MIHRRGAKVQIFFVFGESSMRYRRFGQNAGRIRLRPTLGPDRLQRKAEKMGTRRVLTMLEIGGVLIAVGGLAVSCSKSKPSFEEAYGPALEIIKSRALWPQSPEAVCEAFWAARARKDYEELEVLWPGSASFDWEALCRADDATVTYVFGPADGLEVPYASEEYYRQHGSYNLKMRLGSLETLTGKRYYVVSGN